MADYVYFDDVLSGRAESHSSVEEVMRYPIDNVEASLDLAIKLQERGIIPTDADRYVWGHLHRRVEYELDGYKPVRLVDRESKRIVQFVTPGSVQTLLMIKPSTQG